MFLKVMMSSDISGRLLRHYLLQLVGTNPRYGVFPDWFPAGFYGFDVFRPQETMHV